MNALNLPTTCARCGKRYRGRGEWNVVFRAGVAQHSICPGCQTAEENAEAEINEAGLDYLGTDSFGRFTARPKTGDAR